MWQLAIYLDTATAESMTFILFSNGNNWVSTGGRMGRKDS